MLESLEIAAKLRHLCRANSFDLDGRSIVHCEFWRERQRIPIDEIDSWTVFPEMVFDLVLIRFCDQTEVCLIDKHGQLQNILRHVHKKEER